MKREIQVYRTGKGFQVIDKGNEIFRTEDQSGDSRIRVRNFLIKNDLRADKACVSRFSWLWIRNDLANLRVVDFQTRADEMDLTRIFDKYNVVVDDWMEKDYGILIFAVVPDENLDRVKSEIRNFHGADCTDV